MLYLSIIKYLEKTKTLNLIENRKAQVFDSNLI